MQMRQKLAIVIVVVMAVAAVLVFKPRGPGGEVSQPTAVASIPLLVDLGANSCVPCKLMAPILDQLRMEYAGRFEVQFIDIWQNPGAGEPYGMRVIPTQIFFDASGRELFRHEGFYSREQILGKWRDLGFDFDA